MKIAIASGKGGTGKTTIATSLALSLAAESELTPPLFLDCDVEGPNAHLFLKPEFTHHQEVGILIPEVNKSKCTYCGKCAEVCQYHAIAVLGKKTLVFPQLCHGCGSCTLICPEGAISEVMDIMGVLEGGPATAEISFAHGVMHVGEPMAVPVIRQLKAWAVSELEYSPGDTSTSTPNTSTQRQVVIIDVSPGTSCPVVEAVRGADYLILVTEPTPFGLHDLRLAVQVARQLDILAGVVVNRYGTGNSDVEEFCSAEELPILMRIPFERTIAEGIARGKTLVEIYQEYIPRFQEMFIKIVNLTQSISL
jgi:MinD superfamily P-loop ATPase